MKENEIKKVRVSTKDLANAGIPRLYWDAKISMLPLETTQDFLRAYFADFEENFRDGVCLGFSSDTSDPTVALSIVCKLCLARKKQVMLVPISDLSDIHAKKFRSGDKSAFKQIRSIEVLAIGSIDITREKSYGLDRTVLKDLINYRMRNSLTTLFGFSNLLTVEGTDLENFLGPESYSVFFDGCTMEEV